VILRPSALVALCVLGACGQKFVAEGGTASNGGGAGADFAGAGADFADAGQAGQPSGGEVNSGGALGEGGDAGGGTGGTGGGAAGAGVGGLHGNAGGGAGGGGGTLNEPKLPQSGLLLWLRADRGIQQKDGLVQVWQDQSGTEANATQITATARPAYLATGFNGRPTLEFDGRTQFLTFASGFGDFSKGLAGFIVARPSKSECASMLEFSNGSEVDDIALGMWQDKWTYEVAAAYIQTGTVSHDLFSLYTVNHRLTGLADLRIDGSALDTLDMPLPAIPDSRGRVDNFVGHTLYKDCNYFEGQISEIILYSRAMTNSEVTAIEKYLDARWALSEQVAPTPTP